MGRLFGTDGVRGVANRELTAELAMAIGSASARRLTTTSRTGRRVAVIGRDPRASGEMLEAAVIAGITGEGIDALRVGILPTPAVAYLTSAYDADFGVMISASHNPMPDNGIKVFGPGGHKLDDSTEDDIEQLVSTDPAERPVGAAIGRVVDAQDALDRYLRHASKAVTTRLMASQSSSTAPTAPRSPPHHAPTRRPAHASSQSTPRPTGSTSTTAADRLTSTSWARPSSRTALTWVWRTTATAIGAWPSTQTATWSTATRSW